MQQESEIQVVPGNPIVDQRAKEYLTKKMIQDLEQERARHDRLVQQAKKTRQQEELSVHQLHQTHQLDDESLASERHRLEHREEERPSRQFEQLKQQANIYSKTLATKRGHSSFRSRAAYIAFLRQMAEEDARYYLEEHPDSNLVLLEKRHSLPTVHYYGLKDRPDVEVVAINMQGAESKIAKIQEPVQEGGAYIYGRPYYLYKYYKYRQKYLNLVTNLLR